MRKCIWLLFMMFALPLGQTYAYGARIKDLGKLSGWRENVLVGYGLVTGLAGTGDSPGNKTTRQSIANMLAQFNISVNPDDVLSRNTAAVMVTAAMPPFARQGDNLDVVVTSVGDARSLVGGTLIVAPLKAANNKVYALAQGQVAVGGYKVDQNGNVAQKNHPTSGAIPGGAIVEVGVGSDVLRDGQLTFVLAEPDYTTASRVASTINTAMGRNIAVARDAAGIDIRVPEAQRTLLVDFITRLEGLQVEPDHRAKVVINERTGTVVSGAEVRLQPVVVSQGDLKVTILSETTVSQPVLVRQTSPGVKTEVVTNSRIDVQEPDAGLALVSASGTVGDLVRALAKARVSTRDMISVLRAVKATGAMQAELIVQ